MHVQLYSTSRTCSDLNTSIRIKNSTKVENWDNNTDSRNSIRHDFTVLMLESFSEILIQSDISLKCTYSFNCFDIYMFTELFDLYFAVRSSLFFVDFFGSKIVFVFEYRMQEPGTVDCFVHTLRHSSFLPNFSICILRYFHLFFLQISLEVRLFLFLNIACRNLVLSIDLSIFFDISLFYRTFRSAFYGTFPHLFFCRFL